MNPLDHCNTLPIHKDTITMACENETQSNRKITLDHLIHYNHYKLNTRSVMTTVSPHVFDSALDFPVITNRAFFPWAVQYLNFNPSFAKFLFIYLWFYIAFNTVQVISRRVIGRAEETSTYSLSGFCTVNCRPTASKLPAFPLEAMLGTETRPEVGGESVTILPPWPLQSF